MQNGKPRVYTILHPHIAAWGVREFIFNKLETSESRGRRIISCSLEFDEFDSVSGKSQDRQLGLSRASAAGTEAPVNPPVDDKTQWEAKELERQYAKL